jgi:two-component system CheB/CheR fusion protein
VPLGRDAAPRPRRFDRSEVKESAHQSSSILVVEDDPSVREMLALLLEGEGYLTTTAEDGKKALELGERGAIRPDLVVADYNLPKGLNGLQVVAGLRETLGHQIPAVILTGDISTSALREIAQGPPAPEQAGEGEGVDKPDPALPR